ncbi:hypothetical protein CDD81_1564 [Ophiocordyceps australis]|uniref:Putative ER transporter 6TM N-terminal domain-containing protein n=1 Tax=Ophiocordyceps australis TaxID=1399860 RepID=A0A2C5X817_9HYPO|nr:hypothetical protein CDD81_1564 [Ophiocordyceps australis]
MISSSPYEPGPASASHGTGSAEASPDEQGIELVSQLGRRSSGISLAQICEIVSDDKFDTGTYGVLELRDGFFDATFIKQSPPPMAHETMQDAKKEADQETRRGVLLKQWRDDVEALFKTVATTGAGICLLKSFVAYYAAYILCLVPAVRNWLGRYHYLVAVSVIINHPARPFGAQLDGTVMTVVGVALGLGWGVLGLLVSTSTHGARIGYGGILALFLGLLMTACALVRAFFIRFYQSLLCAGIAVMFVTLAETSSARIYWDKLLSFAVPWLVGQAIALVVNCLVFPDAGARALATTMNASFLVMLDALAESRRHDDDGLRQRLMQVFVNVSQACRDMKLDVSITRFKPDDVGQLRNLMQTVIRSLLSLRAQTCLLVDADKQVVDGAGPTEASNGHGEESKRVIEEVRAPTCRLLECTAEGLRACHAAIMDLGSHRKTLGPPSEVSANIGLALPPLQQAQTNLAAVESALVSKTMPDALKRDSDVVGLFVFARHVHETAASVEKLMAKVQEMQRECKSPRLHLPSYPLKKALYRTNAQVRHDRGGVTAGIYHITFAEIARLLNKIKLRKHEPLSNKEDDDEGLRPRISHATMDADTDHGVTTGSGIPFKMWRVLHRLQGFETKYAFKVCLMCVLLSVPSFVDACKHWWDKYECWWAVAMSWIVMHPQVGGNLQDFAVRACLAIVGAAWSGAAYAAGGGNAYVMAVFAALYMPPMLYRFTLTSHPRSGLVGCMSFTVISLSLLTRSHEASPVLLAVLQGVVFLVGTTVPIVVNWALWPFVARHELRSALSTMMFFMSVVYRSVVGRYVYFEEGKEPTAGEVEKSEILEGRLREGFVRIRQLLVSLY